MRRCFTAVLATIAFVLVLAVPAQAFTWRHHAPAGGDPAAAQRLAARQLAGVRFIPPLARLELAAAVSGHVYTYAGDPGALCLRPMPGRTVL